MPYPLLSEYIDAILSPEDSFEELKGLQPVLDSTGRPVMSSGNFAVVFKMEDASKKQYAVKCFLREQEGREQSYKLITRELSRLDSPYFLKARYLEKEIFVDTTTSEQTEFPVLVMDWVEGKTLDKYIREHIDSSYYLADLAYRFSILANWLYDQPFAHGDLKPDNIIVKEDGQIVLVDYDGMFVPGMEGQEAREIGSPDFRHPGRTVYSFDERIDDFPLASILLSLKLISLKPELLDSYGAQDRLLFSVKDYLDPDACPLLKDSIASDYESESLQEFLIRLLKNEYKLIAIGGLTRNQAPDIVSAKALYKDRGFELSDFKLCESGGKPALSVWFKDIATKQRWMEYFDLLDATIPSKFESLVDKTIVDFEGQWVNGSEPNIDPVSGEIVLHEVDEPAVTRLYLSNGLLAESNVIPQGLMHEKPRIEIKVLKDPLLARDFSEVTTEDRDAAWMDPYGVMYSHDRIRLLKAPSELEEYSVREGTLCVCNKAFENCHKLKTIRFPESVARIGYLSFNECGELQNIIIPPKVTVIERETFKRCWKLSNVYIGSPKLTKIDVEAFLDCKSLTHIDIPDSVKSIETRAFQNCENLKAVRLPASLNTIEWDAFSGCTSLAAINLPELNKIGESAFAGCSSLQTLYIPDTVTTIGRRAFAGCSSLYSVRFPNTISFIGEAVFSGCSSLRTIYGDGISIGSPELIVNGQLITICDRTITQYVVPDIVTIIPESAFANCSALRFVKLHNGITRIGRHAFARCVSLENLEIPDSVNEIEEGLFSGCSRLKTVKIPYSIKSIKRYAFTNCVSLESVIIPDSVVRLEKAAFRGCQALKEVRLSSSLNTIESETFEYCTNLSEIVIPEGIKTLEQRAFAGCKTLRIVNLPSTLESIHSKDYDRSHEFNDFEGVFEGCVSLKSIYIPESVLTIGDFAFFGCESLSEIHFSSILKEIGTQAFKDCKAITSISLPDSVEELGSRVFEGCVNLNDITLSKQITRIGWGCFKDCKSLTDIVLPDNLETVPNWAFYGCSGLVRVTLPANLKSIGHSAFSFCDSLVSIPLPVGLIQLENYAFEGCSSLSEIIIPNTVRKYAEGIFVGCRNLSRIISPNSSDDERCLIINDILIAFAPYGLTSYTIQDSVTSIYNAAFSECEELETLHIPETVVSIGRDYEHSSLAAKNCGVFYGCKKLRSVNIPDTVDSIGREAFSGCVSLEEIVLPTSISTIGHKAFSGCISLKRLEIPQSVSSLGGCICQGCVSLERVKIESNLKAIHSYDFDGCSCLESIKLPDTIATIGANAFYGCKSLTYINFPGELIDIDMYAFYGCETLKQVVLPNKVRFIGNHSFENCLELRDCILPESLETIGGFAFAGCKSIEEVTIPDSINEIDTAILSGCIGLKTILSKNSSEDGRCLIIDGMVKAFAPCGVTEYTIPKEAHGISPFAMAGSSGLCKVILPDYIDTIQQGAFNDCEHLESFESAYASPDKRCLIVDDCVIAFAPMGVTEYTVPEGVKKIGNFAFAKCRHLTEVKLPYCLEEIGWSAFRDCASLIQINIPGNVKKIGDYAFNNTSCLNNLKLPDGVGYCNEL